mgnify:CR=1 FL=1
MFESWERGVRRWNPDRLVRHLEAIDRSDLDRRTGAILSLIGESIPEGALRTVLSARQKQWQADSAMITLPLLHGFPTRHTLPEWGIQGL